MLCFSRSFKTHFIYYHTRLKNYFHILKNLLIRNCLGKINTINYTQTIVTDLISVCHLLIFGVYVALESLIHIFYTLLKRYITFGTSRLLQNWLHIHNKIKLRFEKCILTSFLSKELKIYFACFLVLSIYNQDIYQIFWKIKKYMWILIIDLNAASNSIFNSTHKSPLLKLSVSNEDGKKKKMQ